MAQELIGMEDKVKVRKVVSRDRLWTRRWQRTILGNLGGHGRRRKVRVLGNRHVPQWRKAGLYRAKIKNLSKHIIALNRNSIKA